uniref:Uncharacterized protein n=1 Tax=Arundo donax TaxID=35708 RepID=A0A0A9CGU5_ARUDO
MKILVFNPHIKLAVILDDNQVGNWSNSNLASNLTK